MRYFLIFFITIILSIIIIFYKPYLGVYKDQITIYFDDNIDGYTWKYELDNNNLKLIKSNSNSWTFKPQKNGVTNLNYTYSNNYNTKYTIYYKLKIKNNKIYWIDGYGKGLLSYPNPK